MTNGKKLSEKSIGAVCAVVSIGAFMVLGNTDYTAWITHSWAF